MIIAIIAACGWQNLHHAVLVVLTVTMPEEGVVFSSVSHPDFLKSRYVNMTVVESRVYDCSLPEISISFMSWGQFSHYRSADSPCVTVLVGYEKTCGGSPSTTGYGAILNK